MGLRVGINAAFREAPATGSGQYLANLTARLPATGPAHAFQLLLPRAEAGARGEVVVPLWLRGRQLRKMFLEQVGVPRAASRGRLDLLHYPYFAAPIWSPVPAVVTVHDVIPLLLPEYRGSALVRAYSALVSATTRRARMVVCDSRCSQADAIRVLGLRPERTRVVYLAADEPGPGEAAGAGEARRRFGLGERYVYYVGGLDRRKNLGVLLRAFAQLLRRHPEAEMVVAGQAPGKSALFPDWQGLAVSLGIAGRVRFIGQVSDLEKSLLYSAATAFAFPSLYEGFGLPPLEAMARGTPVLCSDASSLPEVVGDAALLLPPGDVAAWAAALERVWEDAGLRAELREKGLAQASRFSWERTARETVEVYECAS